MMASQGEKLMATKAKARTSKAKKSNACTQWPDCACISRGTINQVGDCNGIEKDGGATAVKGKSVITVTIDDLVSCYHSVGVGNSRLTALENAIKHFPKGSAYIKRALKVPGRVTQCYEVRELY
jgi:hypothetical protein